MTSEFANNRKIPRDILAILDKVYHSGKIYQRPVSVEQIVQRGSLNPRQATQDRMISVIMDISTIPPEYIQEQETEHSLFYSLTPAGLSILKSEAMPLFGGKKPVGRPQTTVPHRPRVGNNYNYEKSGQ